MNVQKCAGCEKYFDMDNQFNMNCGSKKICIKQILYVCSSRCEKKVRAINPNSIPLSIDPVGVQTEFRLVKI